MNQNWKIRNHQNNHHFFKSNIKISNEFPKNISKQRSKSGKNNIHLLKANEKEPIKLFSNINNIQPNFINVPNINNNNIMIKSEDFGLKLLKIKGNDFFGKEDREQNKNRIIVNKIKEFSSPKEDKNKINNLRYGDVFSSKKKGNVISKGNNIFPKNIVNNHNSNNEKKIKFILKDQKEEEKKNKNEFDILKYVNEIEKYKDLLNKKEEEMLELNKKINDLEKEYELKMEIFKERINYLENNNKISEENQNEYYEKNKKLLEKEKEEEFEKGEKKIIEKEKIINQKLLFLEGKTNYLEKEIEKYKIQFEIMKKEKNKINDLENEIIKLKIKQKLNLNLKNPLALFKNPTLIGLNNIGATCFINATLQCLSQTEELTKYFLKGKKKVAIFKKENQLSPIYHELINNLWNKNSNKKSFSPDNFINQINKMNPLFKKGQPGDSKDFIIYILEQLHTELKRNVNSFNFIEINEPLNQYNKKNAFNHFFNEFQTSCSIISDIFFGIIETTNVCVNCKNNYLSQNLNNPICYNYQTFNCLIFPLEEVRKMKNSSNIISLYDCFYYSQKSELFNGQNQNYCNICKQLSNSIYTSKIYSGPNVLLLILNRGKGNMFDVKLDFHETIDISEFIIKKEANKMIYNLYGVITHYGGCGQNAILLHLVKVQLIIIGINITMQL